LLQTVTTQELRHSLVLLSAAVVLTMAGVTGGSRDDRVPEPTPGRGNGNVA
jgi:hypothetical protein